MYRSLENEGGYKERYDELSHVEQGIRFEPHMGCEGKGIWRDGILDKIFRNINADKNIRKIASHKNKQNWQNT
jgi:hypothetical protein